MTDLQQLMRQNVAAPPHDDSDLAGLVAAGRRRARARRRAVVGSAALATAAVVTATAVVLPHHGDGAAPAGQPPAPDAPTLHLSDAVRVEPHVLASHTEADLDADNGQFYDGVTADGLVLFRDAPRADDLRARFALLDPATGEKDRLPDPGLGQAQAWPAELGAHRIVLLAPQGENGLTAYVFDRDSREWSTLTWPGLPGAEPLGAVLGPDGRLYVPVPATKGRVPAGGWPVGADGEADDADAEGDTNHLWSVSLTDTTDVRDEGLTVGDVAFTDGSMVWTDSTNGAAGMVHVRDLATGDEHTFDPRMGERCNLLSFGASGGRIVMGEYCGTYQTGRDDRIQVVGTDGEQVVTIQDDGLDGGLAGFGDTTDLVRLTATSPDTAGTYVYDLASGSLLRIGDGLSKWGSGGPTPGRQVLWSTPVNRRHGQTQWLGELPR